MGSALNYFSLEGLTILTQMSKNIKTAAQVNGGNNVLFRSDNRGSALT